ncbi:MAG: hypothetical protein K2X82_00290 [Gemmataceae bacterium]|nr:hypothetical protein [Gemmataceae bacterium]
MSLRIVCGCLLVGVAAAAHSAAQKPADPPPDAKDPPDGPGRPGPERLKQFEAQMAALLADPYTAFPNLVIPMKPLVLDGRPVVDPDGRPQMTADLPKRVREALAAGPRPIPADAPPLTKVRIAQVNEGVAYVISTQRLIEQGQFRSTEYFGFLKMAVEVFRAWAELEPTPAGKVGAYEDRVVVMKLAERFAVARVQAGTDPPQLLHESRFWRLQAEKELLLLQDELKAAKK